MVFCEYCRVEVPAALGAASCPRCGQTWTMADESTASMPGQPSGNPARPLLHIPGFEIKELLGEGGMGYVVKAVQKTPQRTVAIKVLSDLRFAHRFHREADAMARLNHPHILAIFEMGEVAGRPYFVMEYVDGPKSGPRSDLGCYIPEGGLDQNITKKVLLQVAAALAHVHQHGIIHRDIKPSNIMIDKLFNAKLADFGIAALQNGQQTQLTTHGGPMGTFDYMSPEQRIDARTVTKQSDIYAMGVVAYEMLTGHRPPVKYSPPSSVNPQVYRGWDQIIDRALEREAGRRQESIEEFAAAIERLRLDAPEFHCPACGVEVGEQTVSCPSCHTTLMISCPSCGEPLRRSETECRGCRISMTDVTSFSDDLRQAGEMLTKARVGRALPNRLESARLAFRLVEKALTKVSNSGEAFTLRADIQCLIDTLLLQAADTKLVEDQLAVAAELYEQVLKSDPCNASAAQRLADIEERRREFLRNIKLHADNHRLQEARELLSRAVQCFPNDEELQLIQGSFAARRAEADEQISRIPGLAEQGHWWEVRRIVKSVGEKNLPEKIAFLAVRAEQNVRKANGYVEIGEQALRELRYDTAFHNAEIAIEKVSDHPRARTLREDLMGLMATLRLRERKLEGAMAAARWFGAMRHLRVLPKLGGSRGKYAAPLARIREGIQQANAYAVLFAWFLMGGVGLLASGWLTALISESHHTALRAVFEVSRYDTLPEYAASGAVPEPASTDSPFSSRPVSFGDTEANDRAGTLQRIESEAWLLAFFPIVVSLFSMAFWILGRRVLVVAPIGWLTLTLLATSVALGCMWLRKAIVAAEWLPTEPQAVQRTIDFCLQMSAIAVIGMALGFVAAQPMRRLFRDRFDWSAWRGPLTGFVAIIPITLVPDIQSVFDMTGLIDGCHPELALAAIALCGLLPVLGVVSTWYRYLVLPFVALLAGWLCDALDCSWWAWADWKSYLPVAMLLVATSFPRNCDVGMLFRAAATIVVLLVVFWNPVVTTIESEELLRCLPPVNILLVLWCVLLGELFLPVLDQLDCRFHLRDRIMLSGARGGEEPTSA